MSKCITKKRTYHTLPDADHSASKLVKRYEEQGKRAFLRPYECPDCGKYHLTSQKKGKRMPGKTAEVYITKNGYVSANNKENSILLAPMDEFVKLRKQVQELRNQQKPLWKRLFTKEENQDE